MRKLTATVLAVVLTSGSLPSSASEATASSASPPTVQPIPPGEDKITQIKKGDPAPYDGQVFSNDTALRWGNWLLQYKLRLQQDVDYQKKILGADVQLWRHKYELSEEKYKTVVVDYQKRLSESDALAKKYQDEANNPSWYRSPIFGFAMGVVFTGVCVGAGFLAFHSASK